LKNGLAPQSTPSFEAFCLICWIAVRHGVRPGSGTSRGQSPATLKANRYPHRGVEFHHLAGAGAAVGVDLELGALARRDAARLALHLARARALAAADIASFDQRCRACAVKRIAGLDGDPPDRLAARRVADAADAPGNAPQGRARLEIAHLPEAGNAPR